MTEVYDTIEGATELVAKIQRLLTSENAPHDLDFVELLEETCEVLGANPYPDEPDEWVNGDNG